MRMLGSAPHLYQISRGRRGRPRDLPHKEQPDLTWSVSSGYASGVGIGGLVTQRSLVQIQRAQHTRVGPSRAGVSGRVQRRVKLGAGHGAFWPGQTFTGVGNRWSLRNSGTGYRSISWLSGQTFDSSGAATASQNADRVRDGVRDATPCARPRSKRPSPGNGGSRDGQR